MNQYIINTVYKGIGIGVILIVTITTIVGIVKMWNQIRNQKDIEQKMEYTNNISPLEFTMSCIVLIGYIVGKVWIHYKIEGTNENNTKDNK